MKFFVRTCLEGVRCTWSYTRAGGNVVHSAGRWGNRGNASDLLVHSATAEDCTLALTLSLRLESCFIFGVQRRLAHTLIYSTLFSRRRLRTSNTPSLKKYSDSEHLNTAITYTSPDMKELLYQFQWQKGS